MPDRVVCHMPHTPRDLAIVTVHSECHMPDDYDRYTPTARVLTLFGHPMRTWMHTSHLATSPKSRSLALDLAVSAAS